MEKKRILTGDRPTGKLHIGHYFGSLQKRVEMQNSGKYDMYILIADVQALTDNFNNPEKVRKNVRELAIDYLSCGIDPKKTTIYIQSMIPETAVTEDELVQSASMALAELTQCATVVANSSPRFSLISKVEVIPTGKRMYVILMITSNGTIKNKVCRLEFDLTNEQLEFFDNFMQTNLQGLALEDISDDLFDNIKTALGTYMMSLSPLVSEILQLSKELVAQDIMVKGEKNLLTCKDFNQNEIISFLDNKREIMKFIDDTFSGLQVMFSPEQDSFVIHNSSIITAPFSKGGRNVGALGLIGPMRLDYAKFIPYLEYFTQRITDLLSERDMDDED